MSDISTADQNYKYLLTCVDVFSRLSFVVPMYNKESKTVNEAIEEIIEMTSPITIQCDNGKEFTNHSFKKLTKDKSVEIQLLVLEIINDLVLLTDLNAWRKNK